MKRIILFVFVCCVVSCSKDVEIKNSYVYNINDVNVTQQGSNKDVPKTTTEFISIAYTDLFNTVISNTKLVEISTAYASFGDKKLIEDRIIRQFLADTNVVIPAASTMRNDIALFITQSYGRFFNRSPSDFEKNYLKNVIQNDTAITPAMLYYSFMTSNEYRYY